MPSNTTFKSIDPNTGAYVYEDESGLPYYVEPDDAMSWGLPQPPDFNAPPEAQAMAPAPEPMADQRTANMGGYQLDAIPAGVPQVAPEVEAALTGTSPNAHQVRPPQAYDALQGATVMTADRAPQQMTPGQQQLAAPGMSPEQAQAAGAINEALPINVAPQVKRFSGRPAQWMPESTTVEGIDPERVQRREMALDDLEQKQMALASLTAEKQLAANAAEREQYMQQAMVNSVKADELRNRIAQQEDYTKQEWGKIDKFEQELNSKQIDRGRLWKNDPAAKFLSALMIGFGQFGAALNGGRNTALDLVQQAIDSDIAEQQDEIASSKDALATQKNALARELAAGADPKFAKDKLEYLMLADAENAAKLQAMQTRDEQVQMEYLNNALAIQEAKEAKKAELDTQIRRKATEKYDPGRSGGVSVETPEQVLKRIKAEQGIRDVVRTESGLAGQTSDVQATAAKAGAVAEAKAQSAQAAKAKEPPAEVRKFEDTSQSLLKGIEEIVANQGGTINPETGEISGAGAGFTFNPVYETADRTEFNARARAIGTGYANAIVNLGSELGEGAKEKLIPTGDLTENTQAKLEAMYKDILSRKKALQEKYGDRSSEQIKEYP